LIAGYWEN